MASTFISTKAGTSADYRKYLYDTPAKTDRDGDAILFDFTLAETDASFVKLNRGNYIKFTTDTYPIWFTGYITNEPEYTYLGEKAGVPHWGYKYEASSDEIVLSQNTLGIVPPFLNKTQGQVLQSLAELIAPGLFNYDNVADGMTLARYVVDPTKRFADVAKEFSDAAVFRFYAQDHKLYFVAKSDITQGFTVDGTAKTFSPHLLTIKASTDSPIVNDVVVIGGIEPQNYAKDYFIGSGFDGEFPLSSSAFGINSAVLLDDDFSSAQFDNNKWIEFDTPDDNITLDNGFCNFLGGSGDDSYDTHLDSAQLIPLSGNIRLTHGDFDFVPQGSDNLVCGVIAGLWTQAPNSSYTGCVYGIRVNKTSGVVTLNPIVNGVVDTGQVVTVDPVGNGGSTPSAWSIGTTYTVGQKARYSGVDYEALTTTLGDQPDASPADWALMTSPRYVLRTVLSAQNIFRSSQAYSYITSDGSIGTFGGLDYSDVLVFTTYITEIDPNTGLVTATWPKVWTNSAPLTSDITYANYIPGASNDLHITLTNTTISTPMQAQLAIKPSGAGSFVTKILGPNEVDSMDGQTPFATIIEAGGTSPKQNILGTPLYHAGDPKLSFFKDSTKLISTVPQRGDIIRLSYRSAGAAIGRARSTTSVSTEATNWGDSGIRNRVRNGDITPVPLTSEDCESAAAAIIGSNSYTHYEGKYQVHSINVTDEPVAGAILDFINLPTNVFVATSFSESIYEVTTTLDCGRSEVFTHSISFGVKGDSQRLKEQLAKFSRPADVFAPQDTAEIPNFVAPADIGLAYADNIPNLDLDMSGSHLLGVSSTRFFFTTNQSAPSGGGFEVRYTDSSWGEEDGKNLALRTASDTFDLPRIARNRVIFVRAYDNSSPRLYSRYASSVRCAYPLVPNTPTAAVNGDTYHKPSVQVILPGVADDVWGIEIRADNNSTVLYHASLSDAGYSPLFVDEGNTSSSLSYYVYTFNLLGEFSASYHATGTGTQSPLFDDATLDNIPDGDVYVRQPALSSSPLLFNGDFEASATLLPPPGWDTKGVGSGLTLAYQTTTPASGSRSIQVTTISNLDGLRSLYTWSVVPGEQYKIEGYSRCISGGGRAFVSIYTLDAIGNLIGTIEIANSSSTFAFNSAVGTVTSGAVSAVILLTNEFAGVCEYDGVKVTKLSGIGDSTDVTLGSPTNGDLLTYDSGGWVNSPPAVVNDSDVAFTDITTNNASTSKHGFLKKLSGVSTEFLNGTGVFSTPSGGGGGGGSLDDYATVVMVDSPAGYWRLGEVTGHFVDSSGNGWDTSSEFPSHRGLQGIIYNDDDLAAYFAGAAGCDVSASFTQMTSSFAFEAWVKVLSVTGHQTMVGRDSTGSGATGNGAAFYFKLSSAGDGKPCFIMNYNSGGSSITVTAPDNLMVGERVHIVAESDSTDMNLYLNGALVATVSMAGQSMQTQAGPLCLANGWFSRSRTDYLANAIDEIAVYSAPLGQTRVTAHYKAGVGKS